MAVKGSYGPAAVASPGPTTVVTAPATEYYDVVVIWVNNPTAAAISFSASIGADAAATRIIGTNTVANIPANAVTPFYGPFRIPPGTIFTVSAGAVGLTVACEYIRNPA